MIVVSRYMRDKIKDDYFKGLVDNVICKKYKINIHILNNLKETQSFRHFVDINGDCYKKCLTCGVWKIKEVGFHKKGLRSGRQLYQANCKYCTNLINKNYRIIKENEKKYCKR